MQFQFVPILQMQRWLQGQHKSARGIKHIKLSNLGYFDHEAQRYQPMIHDYQQTEVWKLSCMDGCKLEDCIEMALQYHDALQNAVNPGFVMGCLSMLIGSTFHFLVIGLHNFSCII